MTETIKIEAGAAFLLRDIVLEVGGAEARAKHDVARAASGVAKSEAVIAKLVGCPAEWVEANDTLNATVSWDVVPPGIPGVRITISDRDVLMSGARNDEEVSLIVVKKCRAARGTLEERGCVFTDAPCVNALDVPR